MSLENWKLFADSPKFFFFLFCSICSANFLYVPHVFVLYNGSSNDDDDDDTVGSVSPEDNIFHADYQIQCLLEKFFFVLFWGETSIDCVLFETKWNWANIALHRWVLQNKTIGWEQSAVWQTKAINVVVGPSSKCHYYKMKMCTHTCYNGKYLPGSLKSRVESTRKCMPQWASLKKKLIDFLFRMLSIDVFHSFNQRANATTRHIQMCFDVIIVGNGVTSKAKQVNWLKCLWLRNVCLITKSMNGVYRIWSGHSSFLTFPQFSFIILPQCSKFLFRRTLPAKVNLYVFYGSIFIHIHWQKLKVFSRISYTVKHQRQVKGCFTRIGTVLFPLSLLHTYRVGHFCSTHFDVRPNRSENTTSFTLCHRICEFYLKCLPGIYSKKFSWLSRIDWYAFC